MKSSSTRRVLKSVVGPALGATLGALVAGGCAKEEAKPAPTTTQPEAPPPAAEPAKTEPTPPPPPTAVEPEKPGAKAEPADAAVEEAPAKKPASKKEAPPKKEGAKAEPPATAPRKDVAPAPKEEPTKKTSPSTEWYAGTMLERDIRPMRPARRGTDATVNALLTGLHDPALRPLA
jgi:outer membrane biosynthesis protein TonB